METLYSVIKDPVVLISLLVLMIFKFFPPKSINSWYGYRTPSSMKNSHTWHFAQKYSANKGLQLMIITLTIQLIFYSVLSDKSNVRLLTLCVWLLLIGFLIFKTERKLKRLKDTE
ncbi:MAG: SdpI family protein [Ekhidna sp.]|nr:SdpI family protein [Ekhidna sp.]